jgi:hypothetical protein
MSGLGQATISSVPNTECSRLQYVLLDPDINSKGKQRPNLPSFLYTLGKNAIKKT